MSLQATASDRLIFKADFRSPLALAKNRGLIVGDSTAITCDGKAVLKTSNGGRIEWSDGSYDSLVGSLQSSIRFRFKAPTSDITSNSRLFSDYGATSSLRWLVNISTSKLVFFIGTDAASACSIPVSLGEEAEIAVCWDGTKATDALRLTVYKNGSVVTPTMGTVPTTAMPGQPSAKWVAFGRGPSVNDCEAGAELRLVEVYDSQLSAEEVKDLYEQDTIPEIGANKASLYLPLKSWYYNGSNVAVTNNIGTLKGTVMLGDGTTTSTFPTQLSPKGMSFDGTTDYLKYLGTLSNGTYSIVALMKPITTVSKYIIDCRASGGTGYVWFDGSGLLAGSTGTSYVNGVASNVISEGVMTLGVSGITLASTDARIMASNTLGDLTDGNLLVLAIFSGTLTPQQMSILHRKLLKDLNI